MRYSSSMHKVGIFTGTFDPIHEGHVAFVDAAIQACSLDSVFVIPERAPRGKQNVTLLKHRVAMPRLALYAKRVKVYESSAAAVSIDEVHAITQDADDLYLLIGSDVAFTLKTWPEFKQIKQSMHLVIGVRSNDDVQRIHTLMGHLEVPPHQYTCLQTSKWDVSSSQIRSLRKHSNTNVQEYIDTHSLYEV